MTANGFTAPGGTAAGFRAISNFDRSPASMVATISAVARAKEGDRDALHFLYVHYSGQVYGYVRSIVRDSDDAEDVTQHVFAKLITALGKYDERGVPFFAWLLRLARNAAVDSLRQRRATPTEKVLAPNECDWDDMDRRCLVKSALAMLTDDQREVMILRHVGGFTPAEIAQRMGRTKGSVHGLHHRGQRALQQELPRLDVAPATVTHRSRIAA